ncbi:MAG: prepilin-type N-terminal cleavage/methylation domain-containing protein [Desulfobacula sp.]|jgi:type IV pilus assembly protein PilW|nr:prepilin-type N-terminal cleavage/methylation domain-containing protein [Desulfobacula sp.]MBT7260865.1 prepilin-type N-terminal cleavage/methylation domain-containing protein [Desulfobacula sp.]
MVNKFSDQNNRGVTLIEIMITIAISGMVLGSVFMVYTNQQKTYLSSDHIAEIQQNLRAAILIMSSEIREAGCDPTGKANAGIISATSAQLHFTRDIAGHVLKPDTMADGELDDSNEDIIFGFSSSNDANLDGIADSGAANLGRNTGGGFQAIAEHIQAIGFAYILESGTIVSNPSSSQLNQIRAVQISLLARASLPDTNFENTQSYTSVSGTAWGPYNDSYKRRFATITIQCRNLGL